MKMDEFIKKANLILETKTTVATALIIGKSSFIEQPLREILILKGVNVNGSENYDYIFQLGNFEDIEFFLEKAIREKSKFFLILDNNTDPALAQRTENKVKEFIKKRKLRAKILKISEVFGQEIETARKILKAVLSQTEDQVIILNKAESLWEQFDTVKHQPTIKKRILPWIGWSLFLFFIILSPTVFILLNIVLGTMSLKNTKDALLKSNFNQGKNQSRSAQGYFSTAEKSFKLMLPIFNFLGKQKQAWEIENWLEIGQDLSRTTGYLIEVGQEGQNLALSILGQKQISLQEILPKISSAINLAERELAILETRIPRQTNFLTKNLEEIKTYRKGLVALQKFLLIAPEILGTKEKRTYLVLFQNNFELRPGGGFIGTIGLLQFDNGKMSLEIEDVYTADGQLKGHVEPPAPIKQYLGQIHWYLRDSNWDPDFPSNARRAMWFLEKEIGIRVDGVVAMDLFLIEKILALTGPVEMIDYQETITADNLFLKTQKHIQEEFFPGSTKKRDFLSALTTTLFSKLINNKSFPWIGIVRIANESVNKKHLTLFFNNELTQKLISEQDWGGEMRNVKCQMSNVKCLEDYLMVVDANLGVNKSNYYVKREINKRVNFTSDSLISNIVIFYENNSPQESNFTGSYKNYLRIFTPEEDNLEKVLVNNQELENSRINKEKLIGKQSIGFLVEVLPGEKKKVEISLKRPIDVSDNEFLYQLLVQKQAGTDKDPLNVTIITPSWEILESNLSALVKSGSLSYNSDLSIDRQFTIRLKK